ncbi:hypothetical protein [Bacillus solimangrovi]|uniref:VCBS repeat-containing protein n=1 Tax=Bacillus solimangrovi TaxID=1305675 RepID=A0A1E5LJQ9_9BACI|nr:hypothetical protein [Bacillus solimangrovi]OEH94320.1 hypothetical protein BFG57_08675 [Bacillus solimangrovi]
MFGRFMFITLLLVALTGCNIFESPSSMIQPPKLTHSQTELISAVDQLLPKGAIPISPTVQGSSQTISFANVNGSDEEEAIILYEIEEDYRMNRYGMVLQQSDNTWEKIAQFKIEGYEVAALQFVDLTGDGVDEVIVGSTINAGQNGLTIYQIENDDANALLHTSYAMYEVQDLNQNGINDLTVLQFEREVGGTLTLFENEESQLIERAKGELPASWISYGSMAVGSLTPNINGIILDGFVGAHSGVTEIYVLEGDNIINPFGEQEDFLIYNPSITESKDINNDGILEVVMMEAPKGYEDASYVATPYFDSYYQWDGKQDFIFQQKGYSNYAAHFSYMFPNSWDNVTIEIEETHFKFRDYSTDELLFDIQVIPIDTWKPKKNVYVLAETKTDIYITHVEDEDLQDNFILEDPY